MNVLNCRLIKQKSQPRIICVDNCCQWWDLLQNIFEEILVKLDVFRSIQLVVSTIPKKSSNFQARFARKQMINSLKLWVRQNQVQGATRLMETTSPCYMGINLIRFVKQWQVIEICGKRILKDETINTMEKLKVHIRKRCLSGIPVFFGTCWNEFLHRI